MEEAITSSQLEGAATTREVAKEMIRTGRPQASSFLFPNLIPIYTELVIRKLLILHQLVFNLYCRLFCLALPPVVGANDKKPQFLDGQTHAVLVFAQSESTNQAAIAKNSG
jgi:hypothetical protein